MQAKIDVLTAKLKPRNACDKAMHVLCFMCFCLFFCNSLSTPPNTSACVTNGIGGGKLEAGPKKGTKVPKGTKCTGWYMGKQHKDICEGVGYGGRGWCGVEAPPGKTGTYTSKDGAWGGCVKECPRGLAVCECPNGKPLTGPACNEHGAPGCESCKALYKLSDDKKSCEGASFFVMTSDCVIIFSCDATMPATVWFLSFFIRTHLVLFCDSQQIPAFDSSVQRN